jgi:hypothetical protein
MSGAEWAEYYLPDRWDSVADCVAAARAGDSNAADDIAAAFDCLLHDYREGALSGVSLPELRQTRLGMIELLCEGLKGEQ